MEGGRQGGREGGREKEEEEEIFKCLVDLLHGGALSVVMQLQAGR